MANVLRLGSKVQDKYQYHGPGIVVKIIPGTDDADHGTVYVWLRETMDYGADNCEHYPAFGWEKHLTILEDPYVSREQLIETVYCDLVVSGFRCERIFAHDGECACPLALAKEKYLETERKRE